MKTDKALYRFRKYLAFIIALVFLLSTIASPAFAVEGINSGSEMKASDELDPEETEFEEDTEDNSENTVNDESGAQINAAEEEISGGTESEEIPELKGEFAEGEAIVCYVEEDELCKTPEKLCMLECEEENATEEETEEALEFENLLADAKTIMPLDNQPTKEMEIQRDVLCAKAVQSKKADEVLAVVESDEYSTEELVYNLNQLPNVDYAVPNYKREPVEAVSAITGDYTNKQWAYNASMNKWHMNIPDWNNPENKNAEGTVVAVLDTGVNYNHEDLKNVMWDDGLEYPELTELGGGQYGIFTAAECAGADRDSKDPMDTHGHGSHCAGIIGAEWNGIGVSGAANGVEIMALRGGISGFFDDDLIEGMTYALKAKQQGVNVVAVNNSWGGKPGDEDSWMLAIEDAVNNLGDAGIISCFAAGNEDSNCDDYQVVTEKGTTYRGFYQAKYLHELNSTLIIGSCGWSGARAEYSNYGANTVDIFTPGGDYSDGMTSGEIYSTITNGTSVYGWKQGTSMACPAAAGAVAIIRAQNPDKSISEIISAIKACAKTENTQVSGKCETNGYLDVGATLEYLAPKIKVIFDANGGSVTPAYNGVETGKAYGSLPTPVKAGYTFTGWFTAKTDGTQITAESIFNGTNDITLYAHWTPAKYKVTFNPNGGTVSETEIEVTYNSTYGTLPEPKRDGYKFDGWYTSASGGTKVENTTEVKITNNQTLYAHWTGKEYTVSFDANGGSVSQNSKTVRYESTYGTLPTPTRTGYTFAGWYTDKNSGTKVTNTTKVSTATNHTLYAHWTANTYTVRFYKNSKNNDNEYTTQSFTYGEEKALTANSFSNGDKVFAGWATSRDGSVEYVDKQVVSNLTATDKGTFNLYAKWSTPITVTFNASGGSVSQSSKTVVSGGTYGELPTPNKTGYNFDGWYTASSGGTKIEASTAVTVTANQTLYAHWTGVSVAVTFDANEGSPATTVKNQTYGSNYSLPADPTRTNYLFNGWYTEKTGGEKITTASVVSKTTAHILYAHWVENIIVVTSQNYEFTYDNTAHSGEVEVTNPVSGYTVKYKKSTDNTYSTTKPSYTNVGEYTVDYQVSANGYTTKTGSFNITIKKANITVTKEPTAKGNQEYGGTAVALVNAGSFTGGTVFYGISTSSTTTPTSWKTNVDQLTTTEKGDYYIWYKVDGNANYNGIGAQYIGKTSVTFKEYTVTLNANGGSVTPASITVTYGAEYGTLPIPTKDKNNFAGWFTDNGTQIYSETTVKITSNQTLIAHWSQKPVYKVTFNTNEGSEVADQNVIEGEKASRPNPDPTKAGYTFAGWYTSDALTTEFNFDTSITAATTVYAKWTRIDEDFDSNDVILEGDKFEFSGEAVNPEFTIIDNTGKELKEGTDYTVEYKNCDKPGTGTIEIKFSKKYGDKTIKKTFTIECNHAYSTKNAGNNCFYDCCKICRATKYYRMKVSYLKNLKVKKGKKYFTVKWKKQSKKNRKKFTGYKIQYKKGSNGKIYTVNVKNSKSSKKIKAKSKTVYYYRVCTYKGKYLAAWKGWKKVKTK